MTDVFTQVMALGDNVFINTDGGDVRWEDADPMELRAHYDAAAFMVETPLTWPGSQVQIARDLAYTYADFVENQLGLKPMPEPKKKKWPTLKEMAGDGAKIKFLSTPGYSHVFWDKTKEFLAEKPIKYEKLEWPADGSVTLGWDASSEPDVAGYAVYKSGTVSQPELSSKADLAIADLLKDGGELTAQSSTKFIQNIIAEGPIQGLVPGKGKHGWGKSYVEENYGDAVAPPALILPTNLSNKELSELEAKIKATPQNLQPMPTQDEEPQFVLPKHIAKHLAFAKHYGASPETIAKNFGVQAAASDMAATAMQALGTSVSAFGSTMKDALVSYAKKLEEEVAAAILGPAKGGGLSDFIGGSASGSMKSSGPNFQQLPKSKTKKGHNVNITVNSGPTTKEAVAKVKELVEKQMKSQLLYGESFHMVPSPDAPPDTAFFIHPSDIKKSGKMVHLKVPTSKAPEPKEYIDFNWHQLLDIGFVKKSDNPSILMQDGFEIEYYGATWKLIDVNKDVATYGLKLTFQKLVPLVAKGPSDTMQVKWSSLVHTGAVSLSGDPSDYLGLQLQLMGKTWVILGVHEDPDKELWVKLIQYDDKKYMWPDEAIDALAAGQTPVMTKKPKVPDYGQWEMIEKTEPPALGQLPPEGIKF